jgi:hypothetical protein
MFFLSFLIKKHRYAWRNGGTMLIKRKKLALGKNGFGLTMMMDRSIDHMSHHPFACL